MAQSEDRCVEPSGRRTARMTPHGEIWGLLVGRAFISIVGGYYIYRVVPIQFLPPHYFAVETLPA